MFELFDHTADLGLRVQAATLEELLADSGRGLLAMHVANPEEVRPVQTKTIELLADEPAYLLFDWLSELLFAFESNRLLLAEFEIELHASGMPQRAFPTALTATCRGEPMDPARHVMDHEVKAITYHGLQVEQQNGTWFAEVIVDI
jgi:SHS2 domain-containing protein